MGIRIEDPGHVLTMVCRNVYCVFIVYLMKEKFVVSFFQENEKNA